MKPDDLGTRRERLSESEIRRFKQELESFDHAMLVTRDPDLVRQYWNASQKDWFEQRRDDPELVMLEVIPTYTEYWDRSGLSGLKLLLLGARAMATGDSLSGDEAPHEKISFPHRTVDVGRGR